jgi:predicted transposase YbfD/YdcC
MTTTPCDTKTTTFFQLLDQLPDLDGRDNRGKQHPIALIITGLVAALCCGRDGSLSSLHRHMVNQFAPLALATQMTQHTPISRAQLPLVLAKINGTRFAQLLFDWFGLQLDAHQKKWFAVDGKELRGSIEDDHKRGEACVSVLAHESEQVMAQAYYSGTKESERPTTRDLLADEGFNSQGLTLDALHLNPLTVNAINQAGGVYVIGVKENQPHLYRYCICRQLGKAADYVRVDEPQRGHGRCEQRDYGCFKIGPTILDSRWQDSGLRTLLCVRRHRQALDGSSATTVVSYFVSNARPTTELEAHALFDAIRHHWRIESMHHVRDVTLAEDELRTGVSSISRLMSSLRTLVINLLRRSKPKNMAARLDGFADNFETLIQFLTQELVL